jgi:hypothetical protein
LHERKSKNKNKNKKKKILKKIKKRTSPPPTHTHTDTKPITKQAIKKNACFSQINAMFYIRETSRLPHGLGAVVGVGARPVPVARHRLGVKSDDHSKLLGHTVQQVPRHPQVVPHLYALAWPDLELPLQHKQHTVNSIQFNSIKLYLSLKQRKLWWTAMEKLVKLSKNVRNVTCTAFISHTTSQTMDKNDKLRQFTYIYITCKTPCAVNSEKKFFTSYCLTALKDMFSGEVIRLWFQLLSLSIRAMNNIVLLIVASLCRGVNVDLRVSDTPALMVFCCCLFLFFM